jgi:WS/DGAT/MGAT family acyltransferase
MQQLSELDYMFVQQESPRTPMHISLVLIYEPRGGGGDRVRFGDILRTFSRSLHKSRIFRRKLVDRTLGLDMPWWVEDPDFDLEFHLRHIALPGPGDWRQLCILLARLHARGLDMRRPLWEGYVIEGLNGVEGLPADSFAMMLKIHHSAIDGVSGAEIIAALHSLTDELTPSPAEDNWQGERDPSALKLWSRAYVNNLWRPLQFAGTVTELVPAVRRVRQLAAGNSRKEQQGGTRTVFNARVSSHRVTDALMMELSEIKRIKRTVEGATINDVIVAIVGGALRRYLLARDALPGVTLKCGAPINLRSERSSDSRGNEVGMMIIDMCTGVEDDAERLRAVVESTRASKAYSSAIGADVMMDLTRSLAPRVIDMGFRAASLVSLLGNLSMPVHTVVSNVPGPQQPLYLSGAKVYALMGMGPLMEGMGLFHGVVSGAGRITINFVSCRELMPDPGFYRECLSSAFAELAAGTRKRRRTG